MLFSSDIATNFIDDAIENGLKILGVDGFIILTDQIQPTQDFSNDENYFSGSQSDFIKSTKEMIKNADQNVMFEVILSD